jgi:exopolyphosphatase/pppGpp-phosphohydrolase
MSITANTGRRTKLHIGEMKTVIFTESPPGRNSAVVMSLGTIETGRTFFKHEPPTPLEIEHAIEYIEDELLRIRESVESGSNLYTTDEGIRQIATVSGIDDQREAALGRDLIEKTFDRLTALAMGRPVTQDGIPTNPEFVAALLILREFMHHLQFSSITVITEK